MCEASSEAAIRYLSSLFLLLLSSRPLLLHPLSTSIDNSSIYSLLVNHHLTSSLLLLLPHLLHLYLSSEALSTLCRRLLTSIYLLALQLLAPWAAAVVVASLIETLADAAIGLQESMPISLSLRSPGFFVGVSNIFQRLDL
jgi:hypothetical protein